MVPSGLSFGFPAAAVLPSETSRKLYPTSFPWAHFSRYSCISQKDGGAFFYIINLCDASDPDPASVDFFHLSATSDPKLSGIIFHFPARSALALESEEKKKYEKGIL